jgi:hypothetical protein
VGMGNEYFRSFVLAHVQSGNVVHSAGVGVVQSLNLLATSKYFLPFLCATDCFVLFFLQRESESKEKDESPSPDSDPLPSPDSFPSTRR